MPKSGVMEFYKDGDTGADISYIAPISTKELGDIGHYIVYVDSSTFQ